MGSYSDDMFGGLFDLNHHGETDLFETGYAYATLEETMKYGNDEDASASFTSYRSRNRTDAKPVKRHPVPENPTTEEYLAEKKWIQESRLAVTIFAAVLMLPVVLVAVIMGVIGFFTLPASGFIALLILGYPTFMILVALVDALQKENERMEQLKKNYLNGDHAPKNSELK